MTHYLQVTVFLLTFVASCTGLKCYWCFDYRRSDSSYVGATGEPECFDGGNTTALKSVDCASNDKGRGVCFVEWTEASVQGNWGTMKLKGIERGCTYRKNSIENGVDECEPVTDFDIYKSFGTVLSHSGLKCFCDSDNCQPKYVANGHSPSFSILLITICVTLVVSKK